MSHQIKLYSPVLIRIVQSHHYHTINFFHVHTQMTLLFSLSVCQQEVIKLTVKRMF